MRTFIRYVLFPMFMLVSIIVAHGAIAFDIPKPLAIFSFGTLTFIILLFLEQKYPFKQEWKKLNKEEAKDIFHSLFGTNSGAVLGSMINLSLASSVVGFFSNSSQTSLELFPTNSTLLLQIPLIILISDFGRYWQHRLHHKFNALWHFHDLHHNDNVLNVFKTSRSHIIERILQQIWMYLPLYFLGVNQDALFYFLMINSVLGLFTHANLNIECGLFEKVLMTPKNHKIHHSIDLKLGNTNFGSFTVLWDRAFKTYTPSSSLESFEDIEVGVPYLKDHEKLWQQILYPFIRFYRSLKSTS